MLISIMGEGCLIIALIFAFLQSVFPLVGYYRKNPYLLASARPAAMGQLISVFAAYLLLTYAFVRNDFTLSYVAMNSHASLPIMYRLTAVWGAHEGSILLWVFVLNAWSVAFLVVQRTKNWLPVTLAVLGLMSFCFLCFLLFTSNPFVTVSGINRGMDLNPLLQDPGFVIHPPMLYIGYVGFAVAFAITLAALLTNQLNREWAHLTRQFALAAWCFLTMGIMLGSWWAYRVLGWGGFWFWDPVENASLLPWLSGTALIHLLVLSEKKQILKAWTAFLALMTFTLSVLGTFLVRSGVLISAHTFASDPKRGVFLLLMLAILSIGGLFAYVAKFNAFHTSRKLSFHWLSRDMSLLLNSLLLFIAMLTVLLGTIYPLTIDALGLGSLSVGAPYFNKVMTPLVFLLMVVMGFAPLTQWEVHSFKAGVLLIQRAVASCLLALVLLWFLNDDIALLPTVSLALSFWIILNVLPRFKPQPSMSMAHLGFVMMVIGITFSSFLTIEKEVKIKPGSLTAVGPYQFFFIATDAADGPNYKGIRASFEVIKHDHHVTNLYPEKRIYTVREMVMTKVAIHPGLFRDLYLALGEPLDSDFWSVRFYYKPFVRWIWMGGVLMLLGGLMALRRDNKGKMQ